MTTSSSRRFLLPDVGVTSFRFFLVILLIVLEFRSTLAYSLSFRSRPTRFSVPTTTTIASSHNDYYNWCYLHRRHQYRQSDVSVSTATSSCGRRRCSAAAAMNLGSVARSATTTGQSAADEEEDVVASLPSSSPPPPTQTTQTRVVIAGAGIVGTATAYYLARNHGITHITIIDPTGTIAPAASGKAGGFLALDWNDGSSTQELTRRSFALHQSLADELGAASIQYRRLTCAALTVHPDDGIGSTKPRGAKLSGIEWAQAASNATANSSNERSSPPMNVRSCRPLGNEETIAQVNPKLLCQRLWNETQRLTNGKATLRKGKVLSGLHNNEGGQLLGAQLDDQTVLEADALLFACGPWTASMMKGIKYHSVIIPTVRVLTQCVFFSGCGDPEVYVRPDATAYCTGFPDAAKFVTELPGEEAVRPEAVAKIVGAVREATGSTSSTHGALYQEPTIQQACYLPTTNDGIPVMGKIPPEIAGGAGCYVATGHTCWGILLGPASGECMASLIATQACPIDLQSFSPKRFGEFQIVPAR